MPDFFYAALEAVLFIPTAVVAVFLLAVMIGIVVCRHRWREYLLNLLIAIDQLINTLCGGSPDETISSACYRFGSRLPPKSWLWWLAYRFVNLLFFWQTDHCRGAFNSERERKHLPAELQKQEAINAERRPA